MITENIDYKYWEEKLGINRNDPNFIWHIEQETANELPKKSIIIVPVGEPICLPKLKDVKMPVPYPDPD